MGQPGTDYISMHNEMVEWINAEQQERGVDFAVINGDLFHDDVSFLAPVKSQWDNLNMPYHVTHGNHDMTDESNWQATFKKPWDYGFVQKGVAFMVLNTADEKGKYISPDVETTRRLLAQYAKPKHLFVFMHITPVKWTNAGIDAPEVVSLFSQQKNLKAVFHGHDHNEDAVKEKNGRPYFFDSHVGGNWGTEYRGYRVLEIMNNGDILTFQVNPATRQQVNNTVLRKQLH